VAMEKKKKQVGGVITQWRRKKESQDGNILWEGGHLKRTNESRREKGL